MKEFIDYVTKRLGLAVKYSELYDMADDSMKEYMANDINRRDLPYVPVRLRAKVGEVLEAINVDCNTVDTDLYTLVISELWKIRDVLRAWNVNKERGIVTYISEYSQNNAAKEELLFTVLKMGTELEGVITPTRDVKYDPYMDTYITTISIVSYDGVVTASMYWKDGTMVMCNSDTQSTYW